MSVKQQTYSLESAHTSRSGLSKMSLAPSPGLRVTAAGRLLLWVTVMMTAAWTRTLSTVSAFVHPTPAALTVSILSDSPPRARPFWMEQRVLWMSSSSDNNDDQTSKEEEVSVSAVNVLGTSLECCCANVRETGVGTGFYRNGYCSTGEQDVGRHTVCVVVTDDFLEYSASVGNDLSTPAPHYLFPGLQDGDIWCLCAERWFQAFQAGKAPKVFLHATHEKTLNYVPYEILRGFALDAEEADARLQELNEQRSNLDKLL